jgi:shikimate kinase
MLVEQALAAWEIWQPGSSHPRSTDIVEFLRNKPVFLTGSMGAGKSTVGRVLAARLSEFSLANFSSTKSTLAGQFLDLDRIIEASENQSVQSIFAEKGETAFRALELREFKKHFLSPASVIALGGGTLMNPEIVELIKKVGTLVYLKASPETCLKRIQQEELLSNVNRPLRPLLGGLSHHERLEQLKALIKQREAHYRQAHIQLDTDLASPAQIAQEIVIRLPLKF